MNVHLQTKEKSKLMMCWWANLASSPSTAVRAGCLYLLLQKSNNIAPIGPEFNGYFHHNCHTTLAKAPILIATLFLVLQWSGFSIRYTQVEVFMKRLTHHTSIVFEPEIQYLVWDFSGLSCWIFELYYVQTLCKQIHSSRIQPSILSVLGEGNGMVL